MLKIAGLRESLSRFSKAGLPNNENLRLRLGAQEEEVESAQGRVWAGKGEDVRPLRTIIGRLRRKLGDDADIPTYIFTEPRVGYRMPEGETTEGPPTTP